MKNVLAFVGGNLNQTQFEPFFVIYLFITHIANMLDE